MNPSQYFSQEEQRQIVEAIAQAEKCSSAEIRIYIESNCSGSPLDRATEVFARNKMHKTRERNGVLVYLALESKKCAVIGDVGINRRVPEGFWDDCYRIMSEHFREGRYADGLKEAVLLVGKQLKVFFPCQENDINELPDDILFGK